MIEINEFDPVEFSNEENQFLLEALGKPTIVALRTAHPPRTLAAVKPMLDRVNELIELEKHEGLTWVGVDALKEAIKIWFRENEKWRLDHKRNRRAPRWPSLYSYDAKGRAHRGGPGADAGRVRTWFKAGGERVPFAVQLIPSDVPDWVPPGFTEKPEVGLKVDGNLNRIECFCGHTESFKADSRASFVAARARMSKHLRRATEQVDQHRELHTNEFGS